MAAITTLKAAGSGAKPFDPKTRVYTVQHDIDFSVAANNMAATDTAEIFDVKAKQLLMAISVEVVTAEGGAATIDLGHTLAGSEFFNDLSINSTAGTVTAFATPYLYNAAGKVYLLANTAATNAAKLRITMVLVDLS